MSLWFCVSCPDLSPAAAVGKTAGFRPPPYIYIYTYVGVWLKLLGSRLDRLGTLRGLREGKGHLRLHPTFVLLEIMKRSYAVCQGCHQSWIWEDRLVHRPGLACNRCGRKWKAAMAPDLRRRRVEWASWNFQQQGQQWPKKSHKEAFISPPPGLHAGRPKKQKKNKDIEKKLQEHWTTIPDALRSQLEAMGVKGSEPPPPPDLPTLIKEHLQSLPVEFKEEVEKIIEPPKADPPLNQKLK